MYKTTALILTSLAFSSVAFAQDTDTNYEVFANDFVNSVKQSMKDPSSAMIKDVVVVKLSATAKPFVCASINGKNSYGGYTGFELYHGSPDKPRSKKDYTDILADLWPRIVTSCKNGPFVYKHIETAEAQTSIHINLPTSITEKLAAYATLNNLPNQEAAAKDIIAKYFSK